MDISNEHFEKLNCLSINQNFKQCVTSIVFKFVQNKCQAYMNEVFRRAENIRINTRNSYLRGTVMQIEKTLINHCLSVSKLS